MQSDPLDFASLVALLLVTVTSREVAHAIGPYAAITVGAFAGAGYALTRVPPMSTVRAGWYVIIRVCAALVLSVPAALYVQSTYPDLKAAWTLAPIAFCIGIVDWEWAWNLAKKTTSLRFKKQ